MDMVAENVFAARVFGALFAQERHIASPIPLVHSDIYRASASGIDAWKPSFISSL